MAAQVFHNSCASVSLLITAEAVVGTVIDTLLVGLIFGKLQRSAPRSMSITFR